MERFIQLHLLTSYPPSNLNRDDIGRPKTAIMGGHNRLRISSQCLKRAWRESDIFGSLEKGERTKLKGRDVYESLVNGGIEPGKAKNWTSKIMDKFGQIKKGEIDHSQLVHFGKKEIENIKQLANKIIDDKREPDKKELESLLQENQSTVDIAMFGRMLASASNFNTEAAVQVAHAISVHSVEIEDDYFTAVDDLSEKYREDSGSAHIGETDFAAGLFYLYICIDRSLLTENLSENENAASESLKALVKSAATISPSGKQNSFASRARASYIRSELGDQQPRSLAIAFLEPVNKRGDMLKKAIEKLEKERENMDRAYGKCANSTQSMIVGGEGTLDGIMDHVVTGMP